MITSSQQNLLDSLKGQFENMNKSVEGSFSDIINVGAIKQDIEDKFNLEKQNKAFDENFKAEFKKTLVEIAKNLNDTLKSLGLSVEVSGNQKTTLTITSINHFICHTEEINIYSSYRHERDINRIKNAYFYFYKTPNTRSEEHTDINNLIASEEFQNKVKRLYEKIQRKELV